MLLFNSRVFDKNKKNNVKSNADPKFLKLVMWPMYRIKKKKKSNNIFAWFEMHLGFNN